MLNHTYVVDRHALLVDRYRPNETREKLGGRKQRSKLGAQVQTGRQRGEPIWHTVW